MAGLGRKVWAADEVLSATDLQSYIQDQVVFVYASAAARDAAILAPTEGMVCYLKDTNALVQFDGASWVDVLPNTGTAGTYTKVTTDAKGRVTSGTTLAAADIPALDASKITSGTFTVSQIPTLTVSKLSDYGTGTWTGTIYTGGNIRGNDVVGIGGAQFDYGIKSIGAYNNDLSSQTRKAVWQGATEGAYGYAPSTRVKKQDIVDCALSADAVAALRLVDFRYKSAVAEHGDDAAVEIGLIAEDLLEIPGMERFVFYDDAGEPAGIHYELLALALIPAIQSQGERISRLEDIVNGLVK